MNRLKVLYFTVAIICIILAVMLYVQLSANGCVDPVTNPSSSTFSLLSAHWIGIIKSLCVAIAALGLLWQGFFGNILKPVRSSVILLGLGVVLVGAGYIYSFIARVFFGTGQLAGITMFEIVAYAIGGLLTAWALFLFPNKLGAKLDRNQRIWFTVGIILLSAITLTMVYISKQAGNSINLISSIGIPALTLVTFAAALRSTMIFAGGRIGRPFLLISVGALSLFLFNYLVWMPIAGKSSVWLIFGEFGMIHVLFVFCFLINAVGAYDLTINDASL